METIQFYRTRDPYGCFSNFYRPCPVYIDGEYWPTTEHYFQAMKFESHKDQEEIRLAKTPMDAARMGRDRNRPLRPDWELVKDDVMYIAVAEKFAQHARLREILLGTGDATLVEHTRNDSYWGDGGDGSGQNMLGQILMEVRQDFREGVLCAQP
jgi:hypothetical protein